MTISATTNLTHGQEVTVAAQGMSAGADMTVELCDAQTLAKTHDPALSCATLAKVSASEDGTATAAVQVAISFRTGSADARAYSCHTGGCVLRVHTRDGESPTVAPLTFAPSDASARVIALAPSGLLAEFLPVGAIGSDLYPNAYLRFGQCRVNPRVLRRDCALLPIDAARGWTTTTGGGDFLARVQVRHEIAPPDGVRVTCDSPGACVFLVAPSRGDTVSLEEAAFAPIQVARPSPVQQGRIAVAQPSVAGSTVHVTGTGYAPYAPVSVSLCVSGTPAGGLCSTTRDVVTNQNGEFVADVPAQGLIRYEGIAEAFGAALFVECTHNPGACLIRVYDWRDEALTRVVEALTMLPAVRSARIHADAPLMDHSVVPFSGEGWPANASLTDRLCGPAAANGLRACNFRGFVKTDGMGRFTTSRTVFHSFRYFDFGTPTMDCRVQACDWVFSDPGGATRSVPLTFVPFF